MLLAASLLVAMAAVLTIRAEHRGPRWQVYVFKPLTTTLILGIALAAPAPVAPFYRMMVAGGLLFSLAGDVFLMLPRDRFVPGLVSFLVAHLFYIAAFGSLGDIRYAVDLRLAIGVAYGIGLLAMLWPHLGRLKAPVTLYAAVLLGMAWQASAQYTAVRHRPALLALIGAVLFVASDSILAIRRFMPASRLPRAAVLATYFAAQWLIALSVDATLQ